MNKKISTDKDILGKLFSTKLLNRLYTRGRVVLFYAINDEQLTVTEISDSISEYGYSPEDFISGKTGWLDILHPDDQKPFLEFINAETVNEDAETEQDYRIFTKSGEILWISCVCVAEKDDTGKITHFGAKVKDVSKRKHYEEELEEIDSAIHNVFDHSVDGMLLADMNGIIREWNHGYELMSGLSKEAVTGKTLWDATAYFFIEHDNTEGRRKLESEMRHVLSNMQQRMFFRHIINRETGKSRVISSRCFPVATHSGTMLGIISYDITELMRSWDLILDNEHRLNEEKNRLKILGDHIPNGCLFRFVLDRKTNHTSMSYVSATWEELTGVPANVVMEHFSSIFTVIHHEDRQYLQQIIDKSIRTLSNFNCEVRIVRHGCYRWLQLTSHPHLEDDNVVWEGIILDVTDRKEAEQKLIAEKERLQAIGDNIPLGTLYRIVRDRNTQKMYMEYVSATWEKITGLTPESVAGDIAPFLDIMRINDKQQLLENIMMSEKYMINFELEVCTGNGNDMRWLHIAAHPYAKESRIVWDGIIRDVSRRRKAEDELAKYREELEFLVKERTEELEVANEELHASNEELHRYQTKLQEMVNEKTSEIIVHKAHLEDLSSRQAILIKVLQIVQSVENLPQAIDMSLAEIGKFVNVSHVYTFERSMDGKTIGCTHEWYNTGIEPCMEKLKNIPVKFIHPWFDIYDSGSFICTSDIRTIYTNEAVKIMKSLGVKATINLPLSTNGVNYGFIAFDDCVENRQWQHHEVELLKSLSQIISSATHRRRVETEMRLSQQTMRKVLDNVESGVFVIDMDTSEIIFANKEFNEREGCDTEGKICYKLLSQDNTKICDFCPRLLLTDGNQSPGRVFKWELHHPSGHWYEEISAVIEWIDGRKVQIENSIDITDRKLSEIELVLAKEKAEEADKLKSAFLSNISHEVRTPLNAIIGFLNILNSDSISLKERNECVELINTNSSQLLKLIDGIIDVAKIEVGQIDLLHVPLHLNNMMEELKTFFEACLYANGKEHLELILDDSEHLDSCVTSIDAVRLRQIIDNLLENAIKFTEKGYIRYGYRQPSPETLEFFVEDSGIGLSKDQLEIIFEHFRQADLTNARLYGGTGLGLTIARSLVKLMGGEMWVESVMGKGASFYFTIPYMPV